MRLGDDEERGSMTLANNARTILDKYLVPDAPKPIAVLDKEKVNTAVNSDPESVELFDALMSDLLATLQARIDAS